MIDRVFNHKGLAAGALISLGILFLGTSISEAGGLPYVAPPEWSPDGEEVAVVVNNSVEVKDAATDQTLYMLAGHVDGISMVAWSPDSSMIATASYDQTVKLWNAVDGALLHTLSGHNDAVTAVAWSPDGNRVISSGVESEPSLVCLGSNDRRFTVYPQCRNHC